MNRSRFATVMFVLFISGFAGNVQAAPEPPPTPGQYYDPTTQECHSWGQIWNSGTTIRVARGVETVEAVYRLYNWVCDPTTRREVFRQIVEVSGPREEHREDLRSALGAETVVVVVSRGKCAPWVYRPTRVYLLSPFPEEDPGIPTDPRG